MSSGILATPGCTISAENNSFTIESGQEFQPPFQIKCTEALGLPAPFDNFCYADPGDRVKEYSDALSRGAQRVRVTLPGVTKPLYGVLALFEVSSLGTGPGSRSYRIEIPQQYVDAAMGGRVSVVYESYLRGTDLNYWNAGNVPSWILWLSDQQF